MPAVEEKLVANNSNPSAAISRKWEFRCFAHQEKSGLFLAECVDLNLVVQAKSMNQAIASLKEAISGYLKVVASGDMTGLVPRPSPLSRRLYYQWLRFRFSKTTERTKNTPRVFDFSDCLSVA